MRDRLWQRGITARPGLRLGLRGQANPSLLKLVQETRQKHLKLWQDDIKNFANFATSARGSFGNGGHAYALQSIEGDTSTTPPATTSVDAYEIDPYSLSTTQNGNVYTISGWVTGPSQARIRAWRGNPSTGTKYLDPTLGSEVVIPSSNLMVDLSGGGNTFTLTIDTSQFPSNIPLPLSSANPWVITASAPSGDDESESVLVPLPPTALPALGMTTATFSIDPASLRTVQSGNQLTISGTALEPNNTTAVLRVWVGTASGGKQLTSTFSEILVAASPPISMANGQGTFTLPIDTTKLPAGVALPSATNPYVLTLCDTTGGNEMPMPVLVPPATTGTVPGTAAFSIDSASLKTVQSGSQLTVTGTVLEPNNTAAVVRIWYGLSNGAKVINPQTFAEMLIAASPAVSMTNGSGTFTVAIDTTKLPTGVGLPTSTNPYVATACDTAGGNEMPMPVLVPPATAGTAPGTASFSIDPTSLKTVQSGNQLTVTGTVREPSNASAVIRLWVGLSNGAKLVNPQTFAEMLVAASPIVSMTNGSGTFTVVVDTTTLPAGVSAPTSANPYVATACDTAGGNEMPMPVLVPPVMPAPPLPATPVVTAPPSGGATASSDSFEIKGTIVSSTSRMLVQAWPATNGTKTSGSLPTQAMLEPNVTSFTLLVKLVSGTNLFVLSALDLTSNLESALVALPAIARESGTSSTSSGSSSISASDSEFGDANVEDIEGIGEEYAKDLNNAGIQTVADLLEAGATPSGRHKLAASLGWPESRVLEFVNRADLYRIIGVASEYSDLLEKAGVDTVRELAHRNPAHLHEALVDTNEKSHPHIVRRVPAQKTIEKWVAQAKELPVMIKY